MFKNIARKQHGVTLIEFVVAFAILSVILTAVVTFSRSSISINRNMVNEANGVNQLKNAFNYVSRDTQMAGMVTPTDPTNTNSNHFPLTLRWITYPTDLTTVLYTIDSSGTLVRTESLNGALRSTMTIATNVNLDPAQTNCVWDSINNKLTINIAISKGTTTEVRQFVLTPRVIQSSILNQVATTVTINSSSPNSTYNDTVTFTATILPNVATGLVTFLDNGTPLLPTPTIALSPLGIATYTVSNLSVGSHIITAVYSGDPNYSQSTSLAMPQTVNKANTTVVLTSNSNPSTYGGSVIFTATMAPSGATGTVTFMDGVTPLGTGTISGGVATYATTTLSVNSHSITAVYGGDGNYNTSTSSALSQTVNKAIPTVTVSSSVNPSTYGGSVTFTAAVSGLGVTPTGTVQFKIDGVNFGAVVSLSSGSATSGATTTLAVGNRVITAVYNGDGNYAPNTGTLPGGQTVNKAIPTVTVSSSVNPSTYGGSVTFTAAVSGLGVTPTGTVQFKIDGVNFGAVVSLSSGSATSGATTTLVAGNRVITAVYNGDGNYAPNTGTLPGGQTVNKANTTVVLTSNSNPSTYGGSVIFTATMAPSGATGTVTFMDGVTPLGTGTISGGVATYATTTLSVNSHSITAVYGGDGNYNTSTSSALSQTVNKAIPTVTVSSSVNPSTYGGSVTFTAAVSGLGVTPTGTVQFKIDGVNFGAVVSLSSGSATSGATTTLAVGNRVITAVYNGDGNYAPNTGTLPGGQTVNKAIPTVTVSSSVNPSTYGGSVTFTAAVSGLGVTPTGTVQFKIDGVNFGAVVSLSSGSATSGATTTLVAGNRVITAVYNGDGNYAPNTGTLPGGQTVNKANTTVVLTSNSNPSTYGGSVIFTATMAPSGATGTVTFMDGVTPLGTGTISGGVATYATTTLTGGSHSITAVYGGDGNYNTSTSSALSQTVNKAALSITANAQSKVYGATVTFGSGSTLFTPSGLQNSETVGTVTLAVSGSGGTATAAVGSYTITPSAAIGGTFTAANYTITYNTGTLTVTTAATSTSLIASVSGITITFTANVTPSTATGTVTFYDGATAKGTGTLVGGVAAYSTSTLSVASHSITAVYNGDGNCLTSTSSAQKLAIFIPSADSYIRQNTATTNYGTNTSLNVTYSTTADYNTLVQFNVTSLASSNIDKAYLSLYQTTAFSASVTEYNVSRSWNESQVTWNKATTTPSVNWTTAGGDITGAANSITIVSNSWNNWTVTSDVAAFITGNNYGWLLTTASTSQISFSSKEGANDPELIVLYH
jgi:type II secretory pathway component PulJ